MKIFKFISVIVVILAAVVYIYFPRYGEDVRYTIPAWWEKCLFNICKYQIPEGFNAISYCEGPNHTETDKSIVFLKNRTTGQYLIISKLRGFSFISDHEISINQTNFKEPSRFISAPVFPDFNIITHQAYLPFLQESNLAKIPHNLTLKGITVTEKPEYETPTAKVIYIQGEFTKIGFFKKMPFPWVFVTPVFDFLKPQKGAIAIINNKKQQETVVVVSAISAEKEFDSTSVKSLIDSLTFDKEVYKPALLEGINVKPTTKVKYRLGK